MTTKAITLTISGLLAGLAVPTVSHAGNVGYYIANNPADCVAPTDVISQAGHTPVVVTQLDAASLAPLDALVLVTCGAIYVDPDLDAAVAAGMDLIIDSSDYDATSHPYLPGAPAFNTQFFCGNGDVLIAAGSPIASGPGGTLNDSSFSSDFYCSTTGTFTSPPPAGTIPFLESTQGRVLALGYTYGEGQVAFSMSSFSKVDVINDTWWPAARTYLANALGWALSQNPPEPATTCASEGYTGTKLSWCKTICESDLSPAVLDTWVHRWINRYRELPYCAIEGEGQPQ